MASWQLHSNKTQSWAETCLENLGTTAGVKCHPYAIHMPSICHPLLSYICCAAEQQLSHTWSAAFLFVRWILTVFNAFACVEIKVVAYGSEASYPLSKHDEGASSWLVCKYKKRNQWQRHPTKTHWKQHGTVSALLSKAVELGLSCSSKPSCAPVADAQKTCCKELSIIPSISILNTEKRNLVLRVRQGICSEMESCLKPQGTPSWS